MTSSVTSAATASRGSEPRPLRRSVLVGAALALLVLMTGGAFATTTHRTSTAEAVLVVLPKANLDAATSAAFYETLSRGQIVGTFAEVANNATFKNQALDRLGLDPRARARVSTEVSVVPDTSVILVRVTADRATTAEQVADSTAGLATTYLGGLSDAYRAQLVHSAVGSATSSGLSPALVLMLAAVVAITLGVAAQQAVYHLAVARRLSAGKYRRAEVPPLTIAPAAEQRHAGHA